MKDACFTPYGRKEGRRICSRLNKDGEKSATERCLRKAAPELKATKRGERLGIRRQAGGRPYSRYVNKNASTRSLFG